MENLISLFLLSMLTTEPEPSNHGEMTFLGNSYSTQVQQTPLLMPELHTFIRPEDLTLNIKCHMSMVFSPRLKGWEGNTSYHFPFQRKGPWQVTQAQKQNKGSPVHWNQTATLRSPSCCWSDQGHLAEQHQNSCETQLGTFGGYCKCTFYSTHITEGPVSLPAIYI